MARWLVPACVLLVACSARYGDGASSADASWSQPQWVMAAGGSDEYIDNETLSSDQLELYFCLLEGSGSYKQLWMMSRSAITDPWGTPVALGSDINTPADEDGNITTEQSPRLSPDNTTLYWGHGNAIWYAQRASEQDPWTVQGALDQVNVMGQDQKWLAVCDNDYFMISRSNGNNYDLYEGQLGDGNGPGTLAAELAIGSNQISTFLSEDCLTTYFASDVTGNLQIYTAQRATPTSMWSNPIEVTTFDTATTDKDPWLSNDQSTFYFDSTRFTGSNSDNRAIYVSTL